MTSKATMDSNKSIHWSVYVRFDIGKKKYQCHPYMVLLLTLNISNISLLYSHNCRYCQKYSASIIPKLSYISHFFHPPKISTARFMGPCRKNASFHIHREMPKKTLAKHHLIPKTSRIQKVFWSNLWSIQTVDGKKICTTQHVWNSL